jgi:hypothetical protein
VILVCSGFPLCHELKIGNYVQNANAHRFLVNSHPSLPNKIGSRFGKLSPSGKKLSKGQMSHAIGFTDSALSELQKGDRDWGEKQLKKALSILYC